MTFNDFEAQNERAQVQKKGVLELQSCDVMRCQLKTN